VAVISSPPSAPFIRFCDGQNRPSPCRAASRSAGRSVGQRHPARFAQPPIPKNLPPGIIRFPRLDLGRRGASPFAPPAPRLHLFRGMGRGSATAAGRTFSPPKLAGAEKKREATMSQVAMTHDRHWFARLISLAGLALGGWLLSVAIVAAQAADQEGSDEKS